jgi:hypothetical protein
MNDADRITRVWVGGAYGAFLSANRPARRGRAMSDNLLSAMKTAGRFYERGTLLCVESGSREPSDKRSPKRQCDALASFVAVDWGKRIEGVQDEGGALFLVDLTFGLS